MWIIIFSIILFSITVTCNKKYRKLAVVGFVIFSILFCFRGQIGTDASGYKYYYNHVNDPYIVKIAGFETGYFILSKIFYNLGLSYWTLQGVVSLLATILFLVAITEYTENYGIAFLSGLWFFYYPSLEVARQIISVAIFFFSLKYIDKDWKKYWMTNLIGFFFHRTSIIAFVIYLFYKNKFFKYLCIIGIAGISLLQPIIEKIVSLMPMLLVKYQWYFVDHRVTAENSIVSIKTLEYFIWFLGIAFIFRNHRKGNIKISGIECTKIISPYEKIVESLMLLGLVMQIFLSGVSNYTYRLLYYTDLGFVIGMSFLYDRLEKRIYKILYVLFLILYIILRFYRIIVSNPEVFG